MTNILELRSPGGTVLSWEDTTKVLSWKFMTPPGVNIEKDISARGCGFSANGKSAILNRYHFMFWTYTYRMRLTGVNEAAAEANANNLKASLDAAIQFQLGETGGAQLWLVQNLVDYGQVVPRVFTVLTGHWIPINDEELGVNGDGSDPDGGAPRFPISLEMDLMEGAEHLDGSGYPIP